MLCIACASPNHGIIPTKWCSVPSSAQGIVTLYAGAMARATAGMLVSAIGGHGGKYRIGFRWLMGA